MIHPPKGRRVWARSAPTDLRKGFAGLAGLVQEELKHDLVAGDLFVFISRNRRLLKVLAWDGTGLVLVSKRLGRGQFAELWRSRDGEPIRLSGPALRRLLAGIDITRTRAFR